MEKETIKILKTMRKHWLWGERSSKLAHSYHFRNFIFKSCFILVAVASLRKWQCCLARASLVAKSNSYRMTVYIWGWVGVFVIAFPLCSCQPGAIPHYSAIRVLRNVEVYVQCCGHTLGGCRKESWSSIDWIITPDIKSFRSNFMFSYVDKIGL